MSAFDRRLTFDRRASRQTPPALVPGIPRRWKAAVSAAVLLSALSFLATAVLFTVVGNESDRRAAELSKVDLRACQRANKVRVESNRRIPQHILDARNLLLLTETMTRTRLHEAQAFDRLGSAFHIRAQIHPLVVVLRNAARADARIRASESRIRFRRLEVVDCPRVARSGHSG